MPGNDAQASRLENVEDLALLEDTAREAGKLALTFFGSEPKTWFKDNKSPVSEADMAVDAYLAEVFQKARPDYGWLSEETTDNPGRLACRRTFIVDPIDGTRAFLAGGTEWTVSVAVVENGRPVAAALFCPVREEMFSALEYGGCLLNGGTLSTSNQTRLSGASLTGPHSIAANTDVLDAGFERSENIRSLAYRIAVVAAGRVDVAAARAGASDWDLAAADLLVQEAGGRLTDLSEQGVFYNRPVTRHPALIAAPNPLVSPVCEILSRLVG
ncbi:3'(2'),5'-bisphosphate nucleotidase CysQ [Roseibium algae]|uniref:3'(2'),5'-bisphosphate nucleotidase CysQ n=1 Tax=Roseibium algae TaxID=3123038 RepID=A0ABU8TIU9_9HYPH